MAGQKYYFSWFDDLGSLLFPKICSCCGNALYKREELLCTPCLLRLPRTNFHKLAYSPVAQKFWGRLPINEAHAFLFFRKGNTTQALLHELKYHGRQDIGEKLGRLFGRELAEAGKAAADLIIPLPLHPSKLRSRGYNQCDSVARGMIHYLGGELGTATVTRVIANPTQTKKNRMERWENVERIFDVAQPERIAGRMILLIDDVVTTGATLEACAQSVLEAGARGIKLATLATA